ncbi:MAG: glycosyltransferase family 2 protein [Acidothermaceae bacterium]
MRNVTRETTQRLAPAMPIEAASSWANAMWVGSIDRGKISADGVVLDGGAPYTAARILVRQGRVPCGFVHLPVRDGTIKADVLRRAADELLMPSRTVVRNSSPAISVVICTRDRPSQLRAAIASVLALDYPDFEVIIVDNGPATGLTRKAVEAVVDRRIRLVDAPVQGLARARNVGLLAARHSIVAFTDDDVVVDRWWLHGVADGFAVAPQVACVCGMVASGELGSASQAYFDRRVQWARDCHAVVYSLDIQRPREPLFPFQVGRFGTGANFAVRRTALIGLDGFDERLGIGSPTGGGEDIDIFVRVLLAGGQLVYEPAALVWHRHRSDLASLSSQIRDYGTGLGAWFAKLALRPSTARMMLRRIVPGVRHLWRITKVDITGQAAEIDVAQLARIERIAILRGPLALLHASLKGAKARPLKHKSTATAESEAAAYVEVAL